MFEFLAKNSEITFGYFVIISSVQTSRRAFEQFAFINEEISLDRRSPAIYFNLHNEAIQDSSDVVIIWLVVLRKVAVSTVSI